MCITFSNIFLPQMESSVDSQLAKELVEAHIQCLQISERYEHFSGLYIRTQNDIELYKQALDSVCEIIAVLQDHIRLSETLQKECLPHEVAAMRQNRQWLTAKRDETMVKKNEIERNHKAALGTLRFSQREMNTLKPEITRYQKVRDAVQLKLKENGVSAKTMEDLLHQANREAPSRDVNIYERDLDYVEVEITKNQSKDPSPFENEANWLLQDCTRTDAEKLLAERCSGTFLIRNSRNGQYALSVVVDNKIYHCLIQRNGRGYGFAEPYDIHPTLKSLVQHYSETSLEEHNDALHTTLAYPIFVKPGDNNLTEM